MFSHALFLRTGTASGWLGPAIGGIKNAASSLANLITYYTIKIARESWGGRASRNSRKASSTRSQKETRRDAFI